MDTSLFLHVVILRKAALASAGFILYGVSGIRHAQIVLLSGAAKFGPTALLCNRPVSFSALRMLNSEIIIIIIIIS